jgi:hypothetical protein
MKDSIIVVYKTQPNNQYYKTLAIEQLEKNIQSVLTGLKKNDDGDTARY